MVLPSVEEQRAELRAATFDARRRYRILFVGRFAQGPTDVVASLERALRTLGHTVFHLDTGRHRRVLDESSGARGGYGPIVLRVDRLQAVLDTFRPQVVVCCAGGLVLDEAGSAEFRRRGVLTLGVTLSDPDVQDSVIDHVPRFDVHTTNSALAHERYVAAGVGNTVLMPFGIDRDFVLRDVPPDPLLAADAICIGHAPGRTDRHEVMTRLAESLDVRVYGTGWPLPGAAPVTGDTLLQAARGGTFHVNFPATRAGFTNVKCGVFESVGAGAVLCTGRFDELGRLFEYGTEVVGYADADELARTLVELKQDPDRIEDIRRRSFARLLRDHLYERRWTQLLDRIETPETLRDLVGADRADEVADVLATDHPRPRTLLVSGYFGALNRGDDVLLDALAGHLEERVPDAHVVVAAAGPHHVELDQGRPAFNRLSPADADYWASQASAVVLGPGGLWHDYTIQRAGGVAGVVTGARVSPAHLSQLPLMVRAHGGSFHVFGMGVGPLAHPAAQATVRLSALVANSVVVRDVQSRSELVGMRDWPGDVEVAPDVGYALPLTAPPPHASGRGYLAVNVRLWPAQPDSVDAVMRTVLQVARERDLDVLGVPMQPQDEAELREWASSNGEDERVRVLPTTVDNAEFCASLSGAAAVVAMRLHTNLLAHRCGRPCVGIAYDPKLRAHFAEIGREDYLVELPVDTDRLRRLVGQVLDEGELDHGARDRVRELEERSRSALDDLAERLRSGPARRPGPGAMTQAASSRAPSVPHGWDASEVVDLSRARTSAGNLEDPEAAVRVLRNRGPRGDRFHIDASGPRRGDHADWTLRLETTPGVGVRVELWLSSRYPERDNRQGRLAYQVLVGGRPLLQHDVAAWRPRNSVWVALVPEADHVDVTVRIVALRHCEQWNWGRAGSVTVEAARVLPWEGTSLEWGASSPRTVPVPPAVEGPGAGPVTLDAAGPEDGTSPPRPPAAARSGRPWRRRLGRVRRAVLR